MILILIDGAAQPATEVYRKSTIPTMLIGVSFDQQF
jgi:hypothetical protein